MVANPFDLLTEEIVFAILDRLNDDALAKKSFSVVCKAFYTIESRHRRSGTVLSPTSTSPAALASTTRR